MNDEKADIINMVSEGTITSSEGIALFEALCKLEDISSYESDVEVEDPRHLPPWRSDGDELYELLGQNECARVIASANQQIIFALQEGKLEDIPPKISALDVLQLSRFKPAPKQGSNGGFAVGSFRLRREDNGLRTQGWGFWLSCWIHTELELPPTWGEPMLMQILIVPGFLRLKWEAGEVVDERQDQLQVVSTVENFDDSVITKAGRFDSCLKLKTVIRAPGVMQLEEAGRHDITNKLRSIGTRFIWLAPNVGIVKLLYEHPNNTQTEIELVDYHVQDSELVYFPLSLGNRWRYQWQDALAVHQELIRVMCKENDRFILSCANHIAQIT